MRLLKVPLEQRLNERREPTTFDPTRPGHIIKLIVGLVQEYAALTKHEIVALLTLLGVKKLPEEVQGYLLCAKAVGWLRVVSKGSHDFYVDTAKGEDAATFHMKEGAREKNKLRRRSSIREHWKHSDVIRHAAIRQVLGSEA